MTTEEMQRQIESMMPTPKQIVENIDKKLEEKRLIMKLIDKDLLVKEIKERIKKITDMQNYNLVIVGRRGGYEDILSFLDTLEVKEVDLEKEFNEDIKNAFKAGYELGIQKTQKGGNNDN